MDRRGFSIAATARRSSVGANALERGAMRSRNCPIRKLDCELTIGPTAPAYAGRDNLKERFCCRFAAGAAMPYYRLNHILQVARPGSPGPSVGVNRNIAASRRLPYIPRNVLLIRCLG